MKRIEAIRKIMINVKEKEVVVTSTGKISREVFNVRDRPLNFYVQGSMGASLGIGIGIALQRPDIKVIVIAGDGDILMSFGTLILLRKLKLKNLNLYILDNNSYQSTGGQKTCSDAIFFDNVGGWWKVDIIRVELECGEVPRISIPHNEIKERFVNALDSTQ